MHIFDLAYILFLNQHFLLDFLESRANSVASLWLLIYFTMNMQKLLVS